MPQPRKPQQAAPQTMQNAAESPVLLAVEGLSRQVQGRWIWRDLSFHRQEGERLAIAGPSGSGKPCC